MGKKAIVVGAGGFIGGHLVKYLSSRPDYYQVLGIDIKPKREWWQVGGGWFDSCDMRSDNFLPYLGEKHYIIFHLAADMGGMGHITTKGAEIMYNNSMINANVIKECKRVRPFKVFFSSSVCVYPMNRMMGTGYKPLTDEDVYPADPNETYGWEKLHMEQMMEACGELGYFAPYTLRFQNCYGPKGSWNDGKEKAPAALCRKVAIAKLTKQDNIEMWGDGEQTRSFMYVGDCVRAIREFVETDYHLPLTLGPDDAISINELAGVIMEVADYEVDIEHVPGPEGVRGRHFNHDKLREVLGWVPNTPIREGIGKTYPWIEAQVKALLESSGGDLTSFVR